MSDSHRRGRSMLFVRVADILGRAIVSGAHDADRALPREADLAATHGVGRSAVREALKMLASKGLIESRPRRGTRVRDRRHWNLFDTDIQAWLRSAPVDATALTDLEEMHRIVLPAAAELAATRLDEAAAHALRRVLETAATAAPAREGTSEEMEIAILVLILESSGNRYLAALAPTALTAIRLAHARRAETTGEGQPHDLRTVAAAILASQPALARLTMERCLASSVSAAA